MSASRDAVPVIAIDGPSASGKGTIAAAVARHLGFHYLDSGALYRVAGFAAREQGINLDNDRDVSRITLNLNVNLNGDRIALGTRDISDAIRGEAAGAAASRVAALPWVRTALKALQKSCRRPPGLVADGRDMGSVVFPDAVLKIYLTATAGERAQRRHKQLMEKGLSASMATLLQDIRDRDRRDTTRATAPLKKCIDAVEIDTTGVPVSTVVAQVLDLYQKLHRKVQ